MFGTLPYNREHAVAAFDRLRNQATRRRLWSLFTRQPNHLLPLTPTLTATAAHHASHRGIQSVPLTKIRGSEGRTADFDADFRPLKATSKERWVNIAVAHARAEPLPAVDLIRVNDTYFVRDGHHRISVARMVGQQEIDANVTSWNVN